MSEGHAVPRHLVQTDEVVGGDSCGGLCAPRLGVVGVIQHGDFEIREVGVFTGPDDVPDVIRIHIEQARECDGLVVSGKFQLVLLKNNCCTEPGTVKKSVHNLRSQGGDVGARGHRGDEPGRVTVSLNPVPSLPGPVKTPPIGTSCTVHTCLRLGGDVCFRPGSVSSIDPARLAGTLRYRTCQWLA